MATMPRPTSAAMASTIGRSRLPSGRRPNTFGTPDRSRVRPQLARAALEGRLVAEVDLEHLPDDGSGRGPAVPAVLDHDRERDLRRLGGRIAHEPRVVALVLGELVGVDPRGVLEHLRRAGLAGDLDVLQGDVAAGALGHDLLERRPHDGERL